MRPETTAFVNESSNSQACIENAALGPFAHQRSLVSKTRRDACSCIKERERNKGRLVGSAESKRTLGRGLDVCWT